MHKVTVPMSIRQAVLSAALVVVVIVPGACRKRQSQPEARPDAATRPSQHDLVGQLPAEALRKVEQATVFIESRYRPLEKDAKELKESDYLTSSGTGVIVSRDGLILTNAHVVNPVLVIEPKAASPSPSSQRALRRRLYVLEAVEVWIHSGTPRTKRLRGQVLSTRDNPRDLALLRARHIIPLTALPVADSLLDPTRRPKLHKTQKVWAVGFPLGRQVEEGLRAFDMKLNPNGPDVAVRAGEVSALRHDDEGRVKAIEHSCDTEPGNSGGPLVNARGQLVGLNTWGSQKVGYAIPLEIILEEFTRTLRLMGHKTVDDGRPAKRKLVVEPSAEKDTDNVFRALDAAMAAARNGDVIELGEGKHTYRKDLVIDKSVWIRGAGMDKTSIRHAVTREEKKKGETRKYRLRVRVAGYLEICDVDVIPGLRFEPGVGPEACIYRTHLGVTYVVDSSPSFTDCAFALPNAYYNIKVQGGKARPRFQRVQSVFTITGARPAMLACRCGLKEVLEGADPRVKGCYVSEGIRIRDAKGHYRDNFFPTARGSAWGSGLSISGKSDVLVEGNRFQGSTIWAGGRATVRENYFEAEGRPAVRAGEKASVAIEGNYFYHPGYVPTRSEIFRNPSLSAFRNGIPTNFVYGIAAKGKDVSATLKNNTFVNRTTWGRAISREDGAILRDEGGNEIRRVRPAAGPTLRKTRQTPG